MYKPRRAIRFVGSMIDVSRRKAFPTIVIQVCRQTDLLEVIHAAGAISRFPNFLHGREKQRDQNADDGNDYQQLNKSKAKTEAPFVCAHS